MTSHLVVFVEGKSYPWGREHVPLSEAVAVEEVAGYPWPEFERRLDAGFSAEKRILAWSVLRRDDPDLDLDAVDLPVSAVRVTPVCDDCGGEMSVFIFKDIPEVAAHKRGKTLLVHDATLEESCAGEPEPSTGPTGTETPGSGSLGTSHDEASPTSDESMSGTQPASSASDPGSGSA